VTSGPAETRDWAWVLARHGSRRGIRATADGASILFDLGLSPYVNRREGSRLYYQGEGARRDQRPTGGNAALLACLSRGLTVQVYERLRPGEWRDLGPHQVKDARYHRVPEQDRMAFEFSLEPPPEGEQS
jgi:hypothetical protein